MNDYTLQEKLDLLKKVIEMNDTELSAIARNKVKALMDDIVPELDIERKTEIVDLKSDFKAAVKKIPYKEVPISDLSNEDSSISEEDINQLKEIAGQQGETVGVPENQEDSTPQNVNASTDREDQEYWNIINRLNWGIDTEVEMLQKSKWISLLSDSQYTNLISFVRYKRDYLATIIERDHGVSFEKTTGLELQDLCSHIVGLGDESYKKALEDHEFSNEIIDSGEYKDFLLCIPIPRPVFSTNQ